MYALRPHLLLVPLSMGTYSTETILSITTVSYGMCTAFIWWKEFRGFMIDTGVNRSSIMSMSQYGIFCKVHMTPAKIDHSVTRVLHGVGGTTKTIGQAINVVLMPKLDIQTPVHWQFHIVDAELPSILCLHDLKRMGVELSIQTNCITLDGKSQPLTVNNGLLYYNWNPQEVILYTEAELRKLHRAFGHPSVRSLASLLRKARPGDGDVSEQLTEIVRECEACQRHGSKPRRFKLTMGTEDIQFNHIVAIDVFYIDSKPVLHCVDEATHFAAARFLPSMSSRDVWATVTKCWSRVYLGPPDFLRMEKGSNFTSQEFAASAEGDGITILPGPVECPEHMSQVERYHGPLRSVNQKLRSSLPTETPQDVLQLAVKCVNDTIGPEGLCPTLLVFGAIPKPARKAPAPSQIKRAVAVEEGMKLVQQIQSKRRVEFGLKHKGPVGRERTDLYALIPGSKVLVYRSKTKQWEGSFVFVDIMGDTVCVQMPKGRQIFRSSPVKHFVKERSSGTCTRNDISTHIYTSASTEFDESRKSELKGLMSRGTFDIINRDSVKPGTRIYGTRWVDSLKTCENGTSTKKSRLVASNFKDTNAASIPTRSPTITRWSQRIFLTIAAMDPERTTYVRDISQAYTQSDRILARRVYLRPPPEMDLSEGDILVAKRPLYGIPESGRLWFETYHQHHVDALGMTPSTADPCLLFKRISDSDVPNITALQGNDPIGCGTRPFVEKEESEVQRFKCKPRTLLSKGSKCLFNGMGLHRNADCSYVAKQPSKLVNDGPTTPEELVSVRAKLQYVAGCITPDLAGPVQLMSQAVREPCKDTYKQMAKITRYCKETQDLGLRYVPLQLDTLLLVAMTDAAFGNAESLRSQLGYVVVATDETGAANIVHYGSIQCKRMARSVVRAELLALVEGFDAAFVIKQTFTVLLNRHVPLDVYTDSRTAFNIIAKDARSLEKRLQLDAFSLRESHNKSQIRKLAWIPFSFMLRMKENQLILNPTGWASPRNSETQPKRKVRFVDEVDQTGKA